MSDCNGFFKECLHAWGGEDRAYLATTQSQSLTAELLGLWRQAWIECGLSTTCFSGRHSAGTQGDEGNETRFSPLVAAAVLVTQSCPTLCDPVDCSPSGSSVHWVLQARILEWVAIPFSRGSSWPRGQTWVSCIAGRIFTIWAIRKSWFSPLGVPNIAGNTCMHTNAQTRITGFNIEGWPTCH